MQEYLGKIAVLLSLVVVCTTFSYAQLPANQPEQDCINAIPVCTNVYSQPNTYVGAGRNDREINTFTSCLDKGERNSVWYIFTVQRAGNLCFTITPNTITDDYDWSVFNLTNASCSDIFNDPSLEVSCNSAINSGCDGQTGPNGQVATCGRQNEPCIPVQVGETYVISVVSFDGRSGYTIDFSASTAVIFDNQPPRITAVDHECEANKVRVTFNENILCGSVRPSDFTFSGPGGVYSVVGVSSVNCDSAGSFDREFELEIFPAVSGNGTFFVSLVGQVLDNCRNVGTLGTLDVSIDVPSVRIAASPTTVCEGEQSILTATIPNSSDYLIRWAPGGVGSAIAVRPDTTTTYTVSIIDRTGCQVYSDRVTVNVVPRSLAEINITDSICTREEATITYTGNAPVSAIYNWDFDGGRVVSGRDQGPFIVEWTTPGLKGISLVVNVNGCLSTRAIDTVVVSSTPTPILEVPTAACIGDPVTFSYRGTATARAFYDWDVVGGEITSGNGALDGPGPHTIVYQSEGNKLITLDVTENGCSVRAQASFTVNPLPTIAISPVQDQCFNGNKFSFAFQTSSRIAQAIWDFGDGNGATVFSPVYSYTRPGIRTVQLGVSDDKGCINTTEEEIEVFDQPVAAFNVTPACAEARVEFQNNSTIPRSTTIGSYEWDLGDGSASTQINPNKRYERPGTYPIFLKVVTSDGCEDTAKLNLNIYPNPVADFSVFNQCLGDLTSFVNNSTIDNSRGDFVSRWSWNLGDGTTAGVVNDLTHLYSAVGNYNVTLAVLSDKSCSDEITKTVSIYPSNQAIVPIGDTICFGQLATLRVDSVPAGARVGWFNNATDNVPFTIGYTYITPAQTQNTRYYVQAITPQGCFTQRVAVNTNIVRPGTGSIAASDSTLELPAAIVNFTLQGSIRGRDYLWDFGDGTTSTSDEPAHEYQFPGKYNVTLKLKDEFECEYDFNLVIEVKKTNPLITPSAFSPNGDGKNDFFLVSTRLVRQFQIQIFNRWGQLIFESTDPAFQWNGVSKNGEDSPEGVYVYKVKLQDADGDVQQETGTITLIR